MPLDELVCMPGYLARRLRQIAVALFAEHAGAFDITTQQYTLLEALSNRSGLEQNALCHLLHLDGSTTATLLLRLEEKGLVKRATAPADKRRRLVSLTAAGERKLAALRPALARVQADLLAPLDPADREHFLRLLRTLVERHTSAESVTGARRVS